MLKKMMLLLILAANVSFVMAQVQIKGRVLDTEGEAIVGAVVTIKDLNKGVQTDAEGKFHFRELPEQKVTINVSYVGYEAAAQNVDLSVGESPKTLTIKLKSNTDLAALEVFGERYKQPEKLDAITRMPLRPSEQIQSISVISEKVIKEQGALTITDAVRNVPGVTLFGSYGGVRESMSLRGYRAVPVLKNGVRVDSDFRTASLNSDMEGIESIQVIKGSAAITQGVGNDLGSPGGVINVVTKTPKFVNSGEVSFRTGSWGQFRPTFDVQGILDKSKTVAFRVNGSFERADNYRPHIGKEKVYINPSLEWRPDDKTQITVEMDHLNDNSTPHTSTVNLAGDSVEALYDMPHDKFLGFASDNAENKTTTYAARFVRQIADKLSVRAAYFKSSYKVDMTSSSLTAIDPQNMNIRQRSLSKSFRDDQNSTFQVDLVGRDVYTGTLKHTFQLGFDYKTNDLLTRSYGKVNKKGAVGPIVIDTIDVLSSIANPSLSAQNWDISEAASESSTYGIMAQEVLTVNQYLKAVMGLRYSSISSKSEADAGRITDDAWNPMFGLMTTPVKNLNLFGSYTTTTSLRSASNKMSNGEDIGPSTSSQWEFGAKSDWLDNRLRFNFSYFYIMNKNLSSSEYVPNTNQTTGYYIKAGNLKRHGIETELNGRILDNLQVMLGYAYVKAEYEDSPSYVSGSAPINTPKHTANGWIYYTVDKGAVNGLSIGLGTYFVGKRPVNDHSISLDTHGNPGGYKPFDMPSYVTVNAQLAYTYDKFTARLFFNNLFDEVGYNSYYRGGYINQTDPRNFSTTVSYRF